MNIIMIPILPANKYEYCDDLCIITSYFNPARYKKKNENYNIFSSSIIGSEIPLYTIELVFGQDSFELNPGDNIAQVRGGDIMWQKERLLNELTKKVPKKYKKIAWIDCDVLFENKNWALDTSGLLETNSVVQLFDKVIRLPVNQTYYRGEGEVNAGFVSTITKNKECLKHQLWQNHGHTGLAWACRRELIETIGLYDVCITGNADHLMAHAFCGDWQSRCLHSATGIQTDFAKHYAVWGKEAYKIVNDSLSYVNGHILHLWHGDTKDRHYSKRNNELLAVNFDPSNDIALDISGAWKWKTQKDSLHEAVKNYFHIRNEDGHLD